MTIYVLEHWLVQNDNNSLTIQAWNTENKHKLFQNIEQLKPYYTKKSNTSKIQQKHFQYVFNNVEMMYDKEMKQWFFVINDCRLYTRFEHKYSSAQYGSQSIVKIESMFNEHKSKR